MITYTTNLDEAYSNLFDEIADKGGPRVSNLEQFFGNIQEIAAIEQGKYLRLPLDEPMLNINADTRKIDVDSTPFKVNGIAVQGDHLAETVFFKIDRYFDYMDLMNTQIYIQWKIGNESGRDKCFIKSDSVIPGSIVFGWAISQHITGKSGNLNFAVELEMAGEDGVKYSLNTLVANLAVKDGLILTDPEVYDMRDNVLAILSNSQFSTGAAEVAPVEWISGGGNGLVANLDDQFAPIVNLTSEVDLATGLPRSLPLTMYALATSGRDASIIYSDKGKQVKQPIYIAAPAGALNDKVTYFVKVSDTPAAYEVASPVQLAAWGTDDEVALYVQVIDIEVANVGDYFVHAQGVKYDADSTKIGASAVTPSSVVTVPSAEVPASITLTHAGHPVVEGYEFDESAEGVAYLVDGENVEIMATVDFENPADHGLVAFNLSKDGVADPADLEYVDEISELYAIDAPGVYKVKAYHYRNNETKEKESAEQIVSYLASPITIEVPPYLSFKKNFSGSLQITYALTHQDRANTTPNISCEIFAMDQDDPTQIETVIPIGNVTVADDVITCMIPGSSVINDGGMYKVKVSHSYNGSIYSIDSDNFILSTF